MIDDSQARRLGVASKVGIELVAVLDLSGVGGGVLPPPCGASQPFPQFILAPTDLVKKVKITLLTPAPSGFTTNRILVSCLKST